MISAPFLSLAARLELHRRDIRPGDDEVALHEAHRERGHRRRPAIGAIRAPARQRHRRPFAAIRQPWTPTAFSRFQWCTSQLAAGILLLERNTLEPSKSEPLL
jgi:hypothetical protein